MFWEGAYTLSPAAGAVAAQVFRWNSVYDPDFTGVGTSVRGYTQMAALYGRYRVLGAKATVGFVNISNATPLTVALALNPVTTVGVDITSILAQRHIWYQGLGTSTGAAAVEHTVSSPVHPIYGVPKAQVAAEDDYAAVAAGNPNNGVFLHVVAFANGPAAGACNIQIRIEYDVVWSLPLELA